MLRLYAWVMIIAAGLAVAVALHVTRADPRYSASAEVVLAPTITRSGNYIQPSMPTEQRVANSTEVVSNAAMRVGVPTEQVAERISVTVPVDTQILVLTYTAETPREALFGAKSLATSYLEARNPENGKNAVARLVSPPELPSTPVGINYPVVLGAAILGGLLTGFAAARAWDRVRGRIRTIADAEQCADLDALAMAPHLPRRSRDTDQRVLAGRPQLDSLAARVLGQVEEAKQSSVLVTGAAANCGSAAVALLTALALARMGRVVVLVTADDEIVARMSRERDLKRVQDAERATEETPSGDLWPDARATEQEGLHVVSVTEWDGAGIAASRLTKLLPELHHRLPEALVVIDGPPAWHSAGMALRADKILLVVGLGRCSRRATAAAVQSLDHCAEKMMGVVITPRRRRIREGLVSMCIWAAGRVRRIIVRVAPRAAGPAPVTTRWTPSGATPSAPEWTAPLILEDQRSGIAKSNQIRDLRRRPKSRPSGEPTSSVRS
jgi:Mrp family chromosome partitioning ATPase